MVLADTQTHEDMARVDNALIVLKELKEVNDDVKLIFDGAGTKWIVELSKSDHTFHELFELLKDKSTGTCHFCA